MVAAKSRKTPMSDIPHPIPRLCACASVLTFALADQVGTGPLLLHDSWMRNEAIEDTAETGAADADRLGAVPSVRPALGRRSGEARGHEREGSGVEGSNVEGIEADGIEADRSEGEACELGTTDAHSRSAAEVARAPRTVAPRRQRNGPAR